MPINLYLYGMEPKLMILSILLIMTFSRISIQQEMVFNSSQNILLKGLFLEIFTYNIMQVLLHFILFSLLLSNSTYKSHVYWFFFSFNVLSWVFFLLFENKCRWIALGRGTIFSSFNLNKHIIDFQSFSVCISQKTQCFWRDWVRSIIFHAFNPSDFKTLGTGQFGFPIFSTLQTLNFSKNQQFRKQFNYCRLQFSTTILASVMKAYLLNICSSFIAEQFFPLGIPILSNAT
jgi:hypothetical protein